MYVFINIFINIPSLAYSILYFSIMLEYRYLLSKCLTYQHSNKSNETVFYPKKYCYWSVGRLVDRYTHIIYNNMYTYSLAVLGLYILNIPRDIGSGSMQKLFDFPLFGHRSVMFRGRQKEINKYKHRGVKTKRL